MGLSYYTTALLGFMAWLLIQSVLFAKGYELRFERRWKTAGIVALYFASAAPVMGLIAVNIITPTSMSMYVAIFLLGFAVIHGIFDVSVVDTVFITTCGYAAQHIGSSLGAIVRYAVDLDRYSIWIRYPVENLLQLLVALVVYAVLLRKPKIQTEHRKRDYRIVGLAVLVLFAAIYLNVETDIGSNRSPDAAFLANVICKLYAIILCILVIVIEYAITWMDQTAREKQLMEQMIHSQAQQQKMSNESVEIINRKCHDLKYQMKALKTVQDPVQRSEFIEEMREAVAIYDAIYHTGNDALDMILREKTLLCDEKQIQLSCMADGTCLSFMSAEDIYVLLGNAFDNAIESVVKEADIEKRVISFSLNRVLNMVSFHLENYCGTPVVFENDLPLSTSKEDKNYHGFGTRSIKFLAEKYNGTMVMAQEDDMFYLDIMFPGE